MGSQWYNWLHLRIWLTMLDLDVAIEKKCKNYSFSYFPILNLQISLSFTWVLNTYLGITPLERWFKLRQICKSLTYLSLFGIQGAAKICTWNFLINCQFLEKWLILKIVEKFPNKTAIKVIWTFLTAFSIFFKTPPFQKILVQRNQVWNLLKYIWYYYK